MVNDAFFALSNIKYVTVDQLVEHLPARQPQHLPRTFYPIQSVMGIHITAAGPVPNLARILDIWKAWQFIQESPEQNLIMRYFLVTGFQIAGSTNLVYLVYKTEYLYPTHKEIKKFATDKGLELHSILSIAEVSMVDYDRAKDDYNSAEEA
jgi:hypothetical protein